MKVKHFSKKLISVVLSLSVIASLFVSSGINASAESSDEEFNPSWNYTRNCSIKKSDGSSENIQVAGLPQTGIFFHINDLNNDLEKHPIRVKFSISSNKPLIFGYMTGTFEDIDTDTSDDWSAYSFKNNNRSISLIGADGNGAYEWNSNYYEYSGGVISIPFFKGDISKSDIVRAVSYGLEDNLNEYLSNDYSVKYEITVQDMYGRTISHFDKYDEVNTPEDLSITLTSDEENGKSTISGALATVNYSGATAFDSSTGIYAELSENKKIYPIYADDETKLPNYGIIADLSSVDFSEYPDSKLVVKFNPNGDKKLNSQADNYNDSAVKLSASTGVWNDNTFKANKKDKTVVEAYPDSNSYQYTSVVPIDANNNVIVFRVFPGGSYDTDEKYLSALFNFTYEISLEDKYGRTIKSYSKDDGEVKNASSNYIACGTLSDVDNPIDKWVINLNNGTGNPPNENTGGLKLEFVGDIPADFDYSQLSIKLQLSDRNSCNGYSAFGYSKTKTGNDSQYKSGAVLDYKVKYNQYDGCLASQDRIGYGDDRISEIDFSIENSWGYRNILPVSYSKLFSIIPEASEYSFNYKISSKNLKYKFEIDDSNVICDDKDNIISSTQAVSSKGTALHTIKLKIVYREDASDKSSTICSPISGLPNWGILYDYSNITPSEVYLLSDSYMSFVVDEYLPTSEPLRYFAWSNGGTLNGDVPYNIKDTDGGEYYDKDNRYFLAKRIYSNQTVKANSSTNIELYRSQSIVYPKITEIDKSDYDSNSLDFELNGKYYHPEVTEIERDVFTSESYQGYAFEAKGRYWLINDGKEIFPIISIRPVIGKYAPSSYSYRYYINYNKSDDEMSKVTVWHYEAFKSSNFSFYPDNGRDLAVHGVNSESDILTNEDGFSLFKINTRKSLNDYNTLDRLIKQYDGSTYWVEKDTGKYVGKFNISDVKNGLLVTAGNIIDKVDENPYVNIDLRLLENAGTARFTSIFGEIKDGVFYIKEPHTGDYSTNVVQSYSQGYAHTEGGGILSSDYTYTIHSHLAENEAVLIFPNEKGIVFDYEISTRNISQYNIDSLVDEPTGNIERSVGNNIIYKGSTETTRLLNLIQKTTITFKSYKNTNSTDNTYKRNTVKYVPVSLFDYNFTGKQTSELQFLYDTQSTSEAPQNTWHDGVYSNIVSNKLNSNGLPAFNFTTPFDLFSLKDETDKNGNTKKSYNTVLELSYDEENQMYHYNSLLHAASYDSKRNAILTYQSALGIDSWGMRGAGFFPFNSFNEDGKWGTASEYNANTYLIDEDKINYHFGLSMNLDFKMPETSKSDIIFKFTGDDDVWVFVDGKLVLDLGGIHEAITGTINLSKGIYSVGSKMYELSSVLSSDFASGTEHNIKMFYLERGGTLSNCSIQFNIPIENDVPTYKLSYDSNGATSGKSPIDNTPYFENEIANIINDSGTAEKSGYKFMGWAVKSDSKDNISTIKMDSDKKVYAIWKELEHLELPVTGSNSELIFTVIGILFTGTGVILLIQKKKFKTNK